MPVQYSLFIIYLSLHTIKSYDYQPRDLTQLCSANPKKLRKS